MPAASISLFVMASAPAGWTKVSSVNDRMLRVVGGAGGGTGGTQLISSGVSLSHSHILTSTIDHTHSIPNHTHSLATSSGTTGNSLGTSGFVQVDGSGGLVQSSPSGSATSRTCYNGISTNTGGGNTSAAGAHTHVLPNALADITLAYVDVIQCSKDSGGAPYAYTDYTAEFAWKKLTSHQRLNTLAKNDAYVQYHTTPGNTAMLFFMASPPTGWTKITAQNDKALRMVSGGTGGSPGGGAQSLSSVISLAHAHTIVAAGGHSHSALHTHLLDTSSQTATPASSSSVCGFHGSGIMIAGHFVAGQQGSPQLTAVSSNPGLTPDADPDHSHGGATGSALSDISLAYADVIWCSKT